MRILLLTSMLILTACGSRQQHYPPKSADEINQLIGIADKALAVAQKVHAGAPAAEVQEATIEMRSALDAAREQTDEILRQVADVDDLAEGTRDPMEVSGCISSQRMKIHDIENMSGTAMRVWSTEVGQCAASAIVYFKSVPPGDSGALALALNVIDPIMLVAGVRSGMKRGASTHYLDANESIIAKLGPECGEKTGKVSGAGHVSYQCAGYEVAMAMRPKLQPLADQAQMPLDQGS
jgi:hypothetical protein